MALANQRLRSFSTVLDQTDGLNGLERVLMIAGKATKKAKNLFTYPGPEAPPISVRNYKCDCFAIILIAGLNPLDSSNISLCGRSICSREELSTDGCF